MVIKSSNRTTAPHATRNRFIIKSNILLNFNFIIIIAYITKNSTKQKYYQKMALKPYLLPFFKNKYSFFRTLCQIMQAKQSIFGGLVN